MLVKRENRYFQQPFTDKAGRTFPEREIMPKTHLGLVKYRYQGRWLNKQQMEVECKNNVKSSELLVHSIFHNFSDGIELHYLCRKCNNLNSLTGYNGEKRLHKCNCGNETNLHFYLKDETTR